MLKGVTQAVVTRGEGFDQIGFISVNTLALIEKARARGKNSATRVTRESKPRV